MSFFMIESLISFSIATLALAISPGPDNIYVLTQSLVYLAYKVYTSDEHISLAENAPKKSYAQLFKTGVIMNLVNPKVMIFFLAFFPGFLWDKYGNTVVQFYILGITFMVVSFLTFSSIALAAGRISTLLREWKIMGVVLKWLQILVFVGIAIFILLP